MASHHHTGKLGEDLAAAYFEREGFTILQRNWRYRHLEVDLIVQKNSMLHFIEVKCLRGNKMGYPEESVSQKKIKNLMDAAAEYMERFPGCGKMRIDVLAITLHRDRPEEYFLIEDLYDF